MVSAVDRSDRPRLYASYGGGAWTDRLEVLSVALLDDRMEATRPLGRFALVWSREALKPEVLRWVCGNRGVDAEDVARHFGISGGLAVTIVGELLDEGALNYDS